MQRAYNSQILKKKEWRERRKEDGRKEVGRLILPDVKIYYKTYGTMWNQKSSESRNKGIFIYSIDVDKSTKAIQ